ncbi:MAG: succinate:quinone oxidoreductase (SQR)-like protein [Verrucomicrobiales bacterium]|nr:succinate:quinone oxidoreductase (SQR)-like protein [Verrucomicrobiales bacterium]
MNIVTRLFCSSLGKKFVMAATGMLLFLFVVAHLVGNLQIFLGREAINRYGHFLQSNPELIWPARIGLIVLVVLHIWSAVRLTMENRAARPVAYANYNPTVASYASRTMMWSGLIVTAFIIYHLLHFTAQTPAVNFTGRDFKTLHETMPDASMRHDVYGMMVAGFSNVGVSIWYMAAMALLCMHLSHGVGAMFQSLGWKKLPYSLFLNKFSIVAAWLIFLGYISIPLSILFGFVK